MPCAAAGSAPSWRTSDAEDLGCARPCHTTLASTLQITLLTPTRCALSKEDCARVGLMRCSRMSSARLRPALHASAPMPTISTFYGIVIRMYYEDHAPPHFHARFAEHEALIDIRRIVVLRGSLPRGAEALALMWAGLHRDELLENWDLCATRQRPNKIAPME